MEVIAMAFPEEQGKALVPRGALEFARKALPAAWSSGEGSDLA